MATTKNCLKAAMAIVSTSFAIFACSGPNGGSSEQQPQQRLSAQFGSLHATSAFVGDAAIESTLFDEQNAPLAKLHWDTAARSGSWEVGNAEGPFSNPDDVLPLESANAQVFGLWEAHATREGASHAADVALGCSDYGTVSCCSAPGLFCCCNNCGCACATTKNPTAVLPLCGPSN
jgi:hypothetical protein